MPPVYVSTADMFASPRLTRSTPSAKIDVFSEGYGHNDLEGVAAARFPLVGEVVQALRRAWPFAAERDARAALALLPARTTGAVVRTLARHPLATFAE
jgi:4-diphosphocytidyl-2-C-methyl-D-erythritol kinase